ncbi:MAG: HAD family phosphatase [Treponema sp.]|nr:HAD family phosphatase [Treponema sp.]
MEKKLTKEKLAKTQAVIFDLDGTLIDSMSAWETVGLRYLAKYGIKAKSNLWEDLKPLTTFGVAKLFQEKYGVKKSVEEIVQGVQDIILESYEKTIEPKKGVTEFLKKLNKEGIKMAVATATDKVCAMAVLKRLDYIKYFSGIFCCTDYETTKAESKIFDKALEATGAQKESVIVFEDALHAILTAKKAGYKIYAVQDDHATKDEEAIRSLCDYYINDFTELL